jgi:hypothetical protein
MTQKYDADTPLSISFELLCLLAWLVEHEPQALKTLVTKSLTTGLRQEMTMDVAPNEDNMNNLQYNVIDFFSLLETYVKEGLQEAITDQARQKKLLPTVEHIDTTMCGDDIVQVTLTQATNTLERQPDKDPKDVLCKELLKRWKPRNNQLSH